MPIVLKYGSLNLLEPSGPVQTCNGIALPFTVYTSIVIDGIIIIIIIINIYSCRNVCISIVPYLALLVLAPASTKRAVTCVCMRGAVEHNRTRQTNVTSADIGLV